jgi:hypothetical protein
MLQLVRYDTEQNIVPYDTAVIEGKKIISEIDDKQWVLGDLADRIEPRYGDKTLLRFSEELGITYPALASYRAVARAWPEHFPRGKYSVARALMKVPDRREIVLKSPNLTYQQALSLAMELRCEDKEKEEVLFPYEDSCIDCSSAEEQWHRSLDNLLGDLLSRFAYWDHMFGPEWRHYKISSLSLKAAVKAKKEFIKLVASLKEHEREKKN